MMIKKIIIAVLCFILVASISVATYNYNDELGHFFHSFVPFRQSTVTNLNNAFPAFIDSITVQDGQTIIDINDEVYELFPEVFNTYVPQISAIEERIYQEQVWKSLAPRDTIPMRAIDGVLVDCAPSDDDYDGINETSDHDGIYQVLCVSQN